MIRFTVTWREDAIQELAQLWIDGNIRGAISAAALQIDSELSRDPLIKGQEVSEGLRRIDMKALRAYYIVSQEDRKVEIVGVRHAPQ
jgi:hypothetical protein